MTQLFAYQSVEDAWEHGVKQWCQQASEKALSGYRAWFIASSDGQGGWIRRRLLHQKTSLFGVQFLDARNLRRELCQRLGLPVSSLGAETLNLLLQLRLIAENQQEETARGSTAGLRALTDLEAAGWLDHPDLPADLLSPSLLDFAPIARASSLWRPAINRELKEAGALKAGPPLTVCVLGWDAGQWPQFDLLIAALRSANSASVFLRLPREPAASLERDWIAKIEAETGAVFVACPSVGFVSSQAALATRLEGADLGADRPSAEPELLVGERGRDATALVKDFAARWLSQNKDRSAPGGEPVRLAILCSGRTPQALAAIRAFCESKIPFEDGLGELPEPDLEWQIQRALLRFRRGEGRVDALLTLVELLNANASGPATLDLLSLRRAFQRSFADCQQDDARALADSDSFTREPIAEGLRALLSRLPPWPGEIHFREALDRWGAELTALGVNLEAAPWLEARTLDLEEVVPSEAFFEWLEKILRRPGARRAPEGANRFARISVTTLENAAGQPWGGAVFLDSHEGAWPLYPAQNPVLDDRARDQLNVLRTAGRLLTSADHARLEQALLCELLENCDGPLAFSSPAHDPADPARELHPNEWALRCLVESSPEDPAGREGLLERWRRSTRTLSGKTHKLSAREERHLRFVKATRCDPGAPFGEYCFSFQGLESEDEFSFAGAWSPRDLDQIANGPATFALSQIFSAEPWRGPGAELNRRENLTVGRLVHRWVKSALAASRTPRSFSPSEWQAARIDRLSGEIARTRAALSSRLGGDLTLWWEGALRKAQWATQSCLEFLEGAATGLPEQWVAADLRLSAQMITAGGPLRLRANCDAAILDREGLSAAVCHLIDIRSGSSKPIKSGVGIASMLALAHEGGAVPGTLKVGVIQPEATQVFGAAVLHEFQGQLGLLAGQQRLLIFGQGVGASEEKHERGENLPMATVPISAAILRAKAAQTDALLAAPGF